MLPENWLSHNDQLVVFLMVQFSGGSDASGRILPGARQICEVLKEQILGGIFAVDGRLPSSRALAEELGVSRTTVTAAYEQLLAEGFIEVRQGSRPRIVAAPASSTKSPPSSKASGRVRLSAYGKRIQTSEGEIGEKTAGLIADFRYGDLSSADFPFLVWKRAVNAAIVRRPRFLTYAASQGSARLRIALQGYLWRARTIRCDSDQIIIVNGSQQGLDLCARLLLDPGDRFAIENPCYAMARRVFAGLGASSISIPVDNAGLDTTRLKGVDAKLAYVTPSHQFPLGSVMSVSRRRQLLQWAQHEGAYIVEDDYDSEYRYDIHPVPPLHALEGGENVIYLGTFSKTLSPALRLGYLVVPSELRTTFAAAKALADRHSPSIEQEALALMIETGSYEKHVRRSRRLNHERRETLLNALVHRFGSTITIEGADAGLHILVWFNDIPQICEAALIAQAQKAGIGIHPVSPLYDSSRDPKMRDAVGLVMGYGALDTRQIEQGVHILADVIRHLPRRQSRRR